MPKKNIFLGEILFFMKKRWFFGRFFCFLRPEFGHGRLGHPQSLEYLRLFSILKFLKLSSILIFLGAFFNLNFFRLSSIIIGNLFEISEITKVQFICLTFKEGWKKGEVLSSYRKIYIQISWGFFHRVICYNLSLFGKMLKVSRIVIFKDLLLR